MASPFFKQIPQIRGPITTMNQPGIKMDGRLTSPFSSPAYNVPLSSIFGLFSSLSSLVPLFSNDSGSTVGSAYGVSGRSLMQAHQARQQAQEQQRTSAIVGFASKLLTSILSFIL